MTNEKKHSLIKEVADVQELEERIDMIWERMKARTIIARRLNNKDHDEIVSIYKRINNTKV